MGMGAVTADAQAVQGGNPHGASKVAVTANTWASQMMTSFRLDAEQITAVNHFPSNDS